MIPDIKPVDLSLSPEELAATVEALHDTLLRRLKWTVWRNHQHWQNLDWQIAHDVVDQLGQAYTKAMMTFRTMDNIYPEFYDTFKLPNEVWDLLNETSLATSWDEAPKHTRCDCAACFKMAHV